ncbi:MAG TPA: STAS/SEC14 domain-containing protein [Vicinamibacterales bacterium]
MPMRFYIYPDFRLLFIRGQGVITQTERIETMLEWLRDPAYELCTTALFDISDAQSTPRLSELRQLIAILRQHSPAGGPRKLAIVTAKPITVAVARVFEQLIGLKGVPLEVRIFSDRDEAWRWLRPEDPVPDSS